MELEAKKLYWCELEQKLIHTHDLLNSNNYTLIFDYCDESEFNIFKIFVDSYLHNNKNGSIIKGLGMHFAYFANNLIVKNYDIKKI